MVDRAHETVVFPFWLFVYGPGHYPAYRRPVSFVERDYGTPRAAGRVSAHGRQSRSPSRVLAGHHPDRGARRHILFGFNHHVRRHGEGTLHHDAGRHHRRSGDAVGFAPVDGVCGQASHGHHFVPRLLADDRPEPYSGRAGLSYSQGIPLRGHRFFDCCGSLQPAGATEPKEQDHNARIA